MENSVTNEPPLPGWLPPLPLAAAGVAVLVYLGWSVLIYVNAMQVAGPRLTDFAQYYTAALMTQAHGWRAPYEVSAFASELQRLTGHRDGYANLPAATILALPFTRLPLGGAYAVWNTLLVTGFLAACWRVVPGRGWERVVRVLASLAAYEVVSAIALGQLALAVGGLLVLHWWLLRAGRPVLAGIVLGLAFVKPQNVFLVPVTLALTGQRRAAAAAVATAAAMAGAWLALLGPGGLRMYQSTVAYELRVTPAGHYTLAALLGGSAPALALALAGPVLLTVLVALSARGRELERPIVAGVLGSHLATPYLNASDIATLVPCAWLTARMDVPRWLPWIAVGVYFLVPVTDPFLRFCLVAVQVVWLGALGAGPALRGIVRATPTIPYWKS
jgi:hypothetical protein